MRTIESPGVEIREIDLSLNTQLPVGTTVFVAGYAKQGPTDELINATSMTELEQIFGTPSNAAERYFYQTCKQVIQANGNLLATRLPYGSGSGEGYTSKYSVLAFPTFPYDTEYITSVTSASAGVTTNGAFSGASYLYTSANFSNSANNYIGFDLGSTVIRAVSAIGNTDIVFTYVASADTFSSSNTGYAATWSIVDSDNDQYDIKIYSTIGANISGSAVTVTTVLSSAAGATTQSFSKAEGYYIGEPVHFTIDESTYFQWLQGGIAWKNGRMGVNFDSKSLASDLSAGYAGMIIVNELKSTIDDVFAGYYLALADNSKIDKGSNFDSIANLKTLNDSVDYDEWLTLNTDRVAFALTGTYNSNPGSLSEVVETIPGYDFGNVGVGGFTDSVILALFKMRPTLYNDDERVLDKVLSESYIGSFDSTRTINNPRGGNAVNFFLEDIVNNSSKNMKVFINPNISRSSNLWFNPETGLPIKKVRVICGEKPNTDPFGVALDANPINPAEPHGKAKVIYDLTNASTYATAADSVYGIGEYVVCNKEIEKYIGNLPLKLERALRLIESRELIRLDIVPEAGLGTVWTGVQLDMNNWPTGANSRTTFDQDRQIFDDTVYIHGILDAHTFDQDSDGLLSQSNGSASEASDLYETIYNIFNTFCQTTRKDCVYVADPLRYIFVQGSGDVKVMDDKSLNFSQHIYWPLKNLYGAANSNYACTYANWLKINDDATGRFVWAPPSGYLANLMIKTDVNFFPWYAPAGLTRGVLNDILDIGINPTQKHRDLMYKVGINPIVYWPGDGYVVWGQKTLQKKPSAFDRVNVRRLFLWLEKATLALVRYFVFEQNTPFTRNRLRGAIQPIFDFAKNNEGIYDYMIVCDDRNNTPDVIDRNELVVDIYIKPVRVAEFILVNFYATRTGQNFQELI